MSPLPPGLSAALPPGGWPLWTSLFSCIAMLGAGYWTEALAVSMRLDEESTAAPGQE